MMKLKDIITEIESNNRKPSWSAVVLDEKSKNNLLKTFDDVIPDGWDKIAHHMTINPFKTIDDSFINKEYTLSVTHIGQNDKAIAVKVSGYDGKTNNKFPHITLAVNRNAGGKPKHSNDITDWKPVNYKLTITGKVKNL